MLRKDASIAVCLFSIHAGEKMDWEGGLKPANQSRRSVFGAEEEIAGLFSPSGKD